MLKSCIHNIILPKYFEKVKQNHQGSFLIFSASGGWDKGKNHKPAEKIVGGFQQAGKKKKGSGGNEFLPACSVPKARRGWESVSAIPASAGRQNRKVFVSLIEKFFARGRLKNVKKIFLFCSPKQSGGERKRWGGSIGKILWILLKESSDIVQQTPPD